MLTTGPVLSFPVMSSPLPSVGVSSAGFSDSVVSAGAAAVVVCVIWISPIGSTRPVPCARRRPWVGTGEIKLLRPECFSASSRPSNLLQCIWHRAVSDSRFRQPFQTLCRFRRLAVLNAPVLNSRAVLPRSRAAFLSPLLRPALLLDRCSRLL